MKQGTVKFFNHAKGFGFIKQDDASEDLFVHISGVLAKPVIQDNDRVQYEVENGKKGLMAVKVDRI